MLNRIERYDNDGSRILDSGGDAGNGKIDGYWMKKNGGILFVFNGKDEVAKGGTEADRFERFLDEGFKVFKGEDVPLGGKPPGGKAGSGLSETTERPAGDDRSADDINDDHPVLDNLSSEDAKRLKFWFGDFDNDADAAYRAAAALENVKRYDSDGDPIYDEKDVLSDKIEKGDESDRLEELLDNGPGTLEGDGSWDDHHVTETTKRPPGDHRSADEILDDSPTWNMLTDKQQGEVARDLEPDLLEASPDDDADAAYRVTEALWRILHYDHKGDWSPANPDKFEGGFKSEGFRTHGNTRARQVENLVKKGYGTLESTSEPNLNGDIAKADRQEVLDDDLKDAVESRDAKEVGKLIEAGADPETEFADGVDMLLFAAGTGDLGIVKAIRGSVSDQDRDTLVDKKGVNGETPVMAAVLNLDSQTMTKDDPYLATANYLIEEGADTTEENTIGLSVEDLIDRSAGSSSGTLQKRDDKGKGKLIQPGMILGGAELARRALERLNAEQPTPQPTPTDPGPSRQSPPVGNDPLAGNMPMYMDTSGNPVMGGEGVNSGHGRADMATAERAFWCSPTVGETSRPLPGSGGRGPSLEPAPARHGVGHVGERDGGVGPRDADGADGEAHARLLVGEDVLDARADGGAAGAGSGASAGASRAPWVSCGGYGSACRARRARPRSRPTGQALSAHTSRAVLARWISPSRSRPPSWRAASVTI